jgi:hypothetical protein
MTNLSLSLTFKNVLNPPSLAPSTPFKFYTFGPSLAVIDQMTKGPIITMQFPANTTTFSITPFTLIIGDNTTYTFQINHKITHSINDYTEITFPSPMTLPTPLSCTPISGISQLSCSSLSASSFRITYISVPQKIITFTLANVQNYVISNQQISFSMSVF